MLIVTIAAANLAVSVDDAKARLRIPFDDDDADIERMIRGAMLVYQQHTGRIMAPQEMELRLADFSDPITIPAAPIREVTEVAYLDSNNVEQIVDAAAWYWQRTEEGAQVSFVQGYSWPTVSFRQNPVRIRFSAGCDDPNASGSGDDPALALDERDVEAILLWVGNRYENRESVAATSLMHTPDAFWTIADQRRIYR